MMSDVRNLKTKSCIICKKKISFYNKSGICQTCRKDKNKKVITHTQCSNCGDKVGSTNNTGLCKNCYIEWNKREQFKIFSQQDSKLDECDLKIDKDIDRKVKSYLEREKFNGQTVLKNVGYWGVEEIKNRKFYTGG